MNSLICAVDGDSWTVDTESLGQWISDRWPDTTMSRGTGQRAVHWTWADGREVWVPDHRKCVWVAADVERIAALAVHCAGTTSERLILTDEGYNGPRELAEYDEVSLRAALY